MSEMYFGAEPNDVCNEPRTRPRSVSGWAHEDLRIAGDAFHCLWIEHNNVSLSCMLAETRDSMLRVTMVEHHLQLYEKLPKVRI